MKFTEKKLLDNLVGISTCGDFMSMIDNITYYWNYGYRNNGWCPCDSREEADEIKVTEIFGYNLKIIDLPQRCMNKAALERANKMFEKWYEEVIA